MAGLRPERVSRPAAVLLALAAAFYLIARTTGSGWVVVLLCVLLGTLAAAAALPALALARVEVSARGPRDATVGRAMTLELTVHRGRGLRLRVLDPSGEWLWADAPAGGGALVTPARRGVFDAIDVDVTSAAPLGLVRWRRRLRAGLPAPLEVGPRPVDVPLSPAVPPGLTGAEARPRGRLGHESVRGVREYVPGDPVRLVHWPSTARWGELMVKEQETSDAPQVAIVVDLRGQEGAAVPGAAAGRRRPHAHLPVPADPRGAAPDGGPALQPGARLGEPEPPRAGPGAWRTGLVRLLRVLGPHGYRHAGPPRRHPGPGGPARCDGGCRGRGRRRGRGGSSRPAPVTGTSGGPARP